MFKRVGSIVLTVVMLLSTLCTITVANADAALPQLVLTADDADSKVERGQKVTVTVGISPAIDMSGIQIIMPYNTDLFVANPVVTPLIETGISNYNEKDNEIHFNFASVDGGNFAEFFKVEFTVKSEEALLDKSYDVDASIVEFCHGADNAEYVAGTDYVKDAEHLKLTVFCDHDYQYAKPVGTPDKDTAKHKVTCSKCTKYTANESCSFGASNIVIPDTCDEPGSSEIKCEYCEYTITSVVDEILDHKWSEEWYQDTTESDDYYSRHYQKCTNPDCDERNYAECGSWNWNNVNTETGSKHVCNDCGREMSCEWQDYPTTTPASCIAYAYTINRCIIPGCEGMFKVVDVAGGYGEHVYDNSLDASCNVCSATRNLATIVTEPTLVNYAEEGAMVEVSFTATGDGLKYEWYYRNENETAYKKSPITTKTYSAVMGDQAHNRRVYCVITDQYGNSARTRTVLTRRKATVMTESSTASYAKMGGTVKASITAMGDDLTYVWYVRNSNESKYTRSDVTTPTYSAVMSDAVKNRRVLCLVKDKYGKTDESKTFILREAVSITTQPTLVNYAKEGAKAEVSFVASGDGLKYEWYTRNANATGYTKSAITAKTFTVTMNAESHDRRVYCVVTDQYGNRAWSDTVLVRRQATITAESKTANYAKMGATVKASVTAAGEGLTYTWYVRNEDETKYTKSSITSATYSAVMSDSVKNRRVLCYVKDKYGKTAQSKTFILREMASIVTQPKLVNYAKEGEYAEVKVEAIGDGLTYRWYTRNADATEYTATSNTTNTFTVKMGKNSHNRRVYCIVTDQYGNRVWSDTVLVRRQASIIAESSTASYAKKGEAATASVTAVGDGLTYTWYYRNESDTAYTKSSIKSATYSAVMSDTVKNRRLYCIVKDQYGKTARSKTFILRETV